MPFDIEGYLEERGGKRSGSDRLQMVLDCPFCGGQNGLYVNLEYAEEGEITRPVGAWICYKCSPISKSRSFAPLLAILEDVATPEARRMLIANVCEAPPVIPPPPRQGGERRAISPLTAHAGDIPAALLRLIPEYVPVFDGRTWRMPRYLSARHVPREVAAAYHLGYCTSGRLTDRIVLPLIDEENVDYTARAIRPEERLRYISGAHAGQMVFGWHLLQGAKLEALVLVEGPFDALAFARLRIPVLALLGKSLSRKKLNLVQRLRPQRLVVCLDQGEARAAALEALGANLDAWIVPDLEGWKDPGEAPDEVLSRAIQRAVPAGQALMGAIRSKLDEYMLRL